MNINDKILVAGSRGMVGSSIVRLLEKQGYTNILTPGRDEVDFARQSNTEKWFEENKPDYIFLSAAKVGGIAANNTYKAEFIYQNMMIAANIIHSAYLSGTKKLLNLGSSCIYPKNCPQPIDESSLLTGTLEPTNEPYAIAKIAAIKLCNSYNFQYGTDFISLMPTNLYGPKDNYDLETSHVLPAILRKAFLAGALNEGRIYDIINDLKCRKLGKGLDEIIDFDSTDSIINALSKAGISPGKFKVWGSGKVRREFLHTDDLAQAALHFIKNVSAEQLPLGYANIGTGRDISISELSDIIINETGSDCIAEYDTSKPDGTARKLLNVELAEYLGWKYNISLRDGIGSVFDDYVKNINS